MIPPPQICPICRTELPPDAPLGMCPRCLLLLGERARQAENTPPGAGTAANEEAATLAPGTRLGDFVVIGLLGRGGMGEVYKAEDVELQRVVALKLLPPALSIDETMIARFRSEARTLALLSHPNIVPIYAFKSVEGRHFFAMEYVKGQDLGAYLKSNPFLSPRQTLGLMRQAASALGAAHEYERPILHRDIKPQNMMIEESGRLRLMDFGLARMIDAVTTRLTEPGHFVGALAYASPEQCRDEALDPRSDLYSLGVVFYECLTARLPYSGSSPQSFINNICNATPTPLRIYRPVLSPQIEQMVLRLLSKRPAQRYESAKELIEDIDRIDRSLLAVSESDLGRDRDWSGVHPTPQCQRGAGGNESGREGGRGIRSRLFTRWSAAALTTIVVILIGIILAHRGGGIIEAPGSIETEERQDVSTEKPTIPAPSPEASLKSKTGADVAPQDGTAAISTSQEAPQSQHPPRFLLDPGSPEVVEAVAFLRKSVSELERIKQEIGDKKKDIQEKYHTKEIWDAQRLVRGFDQLIGGLEGGQHAPPVSSSVWLAKNNLKGFNGRLEHFLDSQREQGALSGDSREVEDILNRLGKLGAGDKAPPEDVARLQVLTREIDRLATELDRSAKDAQKGSPMAGHFRIEFLLSPLTTGLSAYDGAQYVRAGNCFTAARQTLSGIGSGALRRLEADKRVTFSEQDFLAALTTLNQLGKYREEDLIPVFARVKNATGSFLGTSADGFEGKVRDCLYQSMRSAGLPVREWPHIEGSRYIIEISYQLEQEGDRTSPASPLSKNLTLLTSYHVTVLDTATDKSVTVFDGKSQHGFNHLDFIGLVGIHQGAEALRLVDCDCFDFEKHFQVIELKP